MSTLVRHSLTDAQDVRHAVADAHVSLPGQGPLQGVQVPPWHLAVERVFPEHVDEEQTIPSATTVHVPAFPVRLHFLHTSVHALSQQTPSTQWPDLQALALPKHSAPLGRSATHFPLMHWNAPTQSAMVLVQLVLQVDPVAQP
jgi:hypothetical protein